MAKKNWDKLQSQNLEDTVKYRDVYEEQQLERSKIEEKQSPVSRIVFTSIVSVIVFLVVYSIASAVGGIIDYTKHSNTVITASEDAGIPDGYVSYNGKLYKVLDDNSGYEDEDGNQFTAFRKESLLINPSNLSIDWKPSLPKAFISLAVALIVFGIMYQYMMRNLKAQNMLSDTSDINQYQNDQHIALPEEVMRKFDWFPDVGAHSNVQVSSMISHVALLNKGINPITMAMRADKDILDEDGDVEYFKDEILYNEDDEPITKKLPLFDKKFMDSVFEASGSPDNKAYRKYYDATSIEYNPDGKERTKQGGTWKTVADMINHDWSFPLYETQRPGGAYLVDTEPVNTMVLAITRAGKGQTVIEPTIDMWTREKRPNNMVINDPKGELLCKFYVPGTVRGFQIVQFNLINSMKTDIYNPLAMAANAAQEGDFTKCAMYVENIADVFFPVDGGDDPVWPNAANNAFKRAAYGLIDYYIEEEAQFRMEAEKQNLSETVIEAHVDKMWGHVTLYNCYQLFVQLSSKKKANPLSELASEWFEKYSEIFKYSFLKAGSCDNILTVLRYAADGMIIKEDGSTTESKKISSVANNLELNNQLISVLEKEFEVAKKKSELFWEDKPDVDMLSLYFNATDYLPRNQMRTLVANANNALKSMAGAEKMLASVYGIAITAMSFFTDPTISTLTSGTPSQNVDLAGISFPRRFGVRFNADFVKQFSLVGMRAKWESFEDNMFSKSLGKDFLHDDIVTREGWARYYFKGIYPKDVAFIRLQIANPQTNQLIKTFYFKFTKQYQTSLDARYYIKDPILEERIVKNGVLIEMRPVLTKDNKIKSFVTGKKATFKQKKVVDIRNQGDLEVVDTNIIIKHMVRYSEKPKMVFLVTPPHLMKYAKLILILIKQLVDLNFDQSYMTKSNQKPLYKTRFMLDELGNLQSEGHGISGFETMLSIGLGQEQQFTIILQTLQQLRDVYGVKILSTNRVAAYS